MLVDNSAASFLCQPENSIPIIPFEGDENDCELLDLEKYLSEMAGEEDIRKMARRTFKLEQYNLFEDLEELVDKLFRSEGKSIIDFQ